MLEHETREMNRGEREDQKAQLELAGQWDVIAELLRRAISLLEKLKEQKQ
jgi:hypothetical protein